MAIIVPAILEENIEDFEYKVSQIEKIPGVQRIQVDFGDGVFVPHKTLSVLEIQPLSPGFDWEAHLMVMEPVDFLDYKIAGFSTIIVHFEAFASTIQIRPTIEQIKSLGLKVGLAVNPETELDEVLEFASLVDQVTIMSVKPGFQKQSFLPISEDKVVRLRQKLPHVIIETDGGIKLEQISPLARAGADYLVIGSAIFETEDIKQNYEKLESELY